VSIDDRANTVDDRAITVRMQEMSDERLARGWTIEGGIRVTGDDHLQARG
jgi:hypothetical protein